MKRIIEKSTNKLVSVLESTVNLEYINFNEYELKEDELSLKEKEWILDTQVRLTRNQFLKDSDLFMLSDFPIDEAKRNEWVVYRQLLRDFPSTVNLDEIDYLDQVVWPVKPEE